LDKVAFFLITLMALQSCEKNNNPPTDINDLVNNENNIIKDIEGNVYDVVVIGNQTWMKQNLKTKYYNDSTPIATGLTGIEYVEAEKGVYSVYDDDLNNENVYGLLYNWYAIADPKKICPQGWHVPTDEEWKELTDYLTDTSGKAGGKLKSLSLWEMPNIEANNSSGFSALPGGLRIDAGYSNINKQANFWTSTPNTSASSWFRFLRYDSDVVTRAPTISYYGASVRCIKD
jgi:uncharacterized protein (TIGR02145 family)